MQNKYGQTIVTLENVVSPKTYADTHDMDIRHLRRFLRKCDALPDGVTLWDKRYLINRDAVITLPAVKSRGKQRDDGRQRFVVYVHPDTDELQQIKNIVGVANVWDPRIAAKQRRELKRANETE